jgi:hypothetical protein
VAELGPVDRDLTSDLVGGEGGPSASQPTAGRKDERLGQVSEVVGPGMRFSEGTRTSLSRKMAWSAARQEVFPVMTSVVKPAESVSTMKPLMRHRRHEPTRRRRQRPSRW